MTEDDAPRMHITSSRRSYLKKKEKKEIDDNDSNNNNSIINVTYEIKLIVIMVSKVKLIKVDYDINIAIYIIYV